MSARLAGLLLFLVGCGGSPSAAPSAAPTAMLTCAPISGSPGARFSDAEALMFETCDVFLPQFSYLLDRTCSVAAPTLAQALAASLDGEPYGFEARERRAHLLLDAARPFIPKKCFASSKLDREDTGRSIFEVKPDWRSCPPDAPLHEALTVDRGSGIDYDLAYVNAGSYFWALAIAPRVGPMGRQWLRKFLVCDAFASAAGRPGFPDERHHLLRHVPPDDASP